MIDVTKITPEVLEELKNSITATSPTQFRAYFERIASMLGLTLAPDSLSDEHIIAMQEELTNKLLDWHNGTTNLN